MSLQQTDNFRTAFRKRHFPVPADYRTVYKMGLILLVLDKASSGTKASLSKLHFLIWALKSRRNREFIRGILQSGDTSNVVSWGIEPALNKALQFAIAEGLIDFASDRYRLAEKGKVWLKEIKADKSLLSEEKVFLQEIGKQNVSEIFVNNLINKLSG
jgi:hypothetical protein